MSPSSLDPKPPRLAQPALLLLVAVTVCAAWVMLAPKRGGTPFFADGGAAQPDEVSIDFLRAALEENPEDDDVRLDLARAQAAMGHLADARDTLTPLETQTGGRGVQARLLWLDLDMTEWRAHAKADAVPLGRLRGLLKERLPTEAKEQVAQACLELGKPELAAEIYLELARAGPAPVRARLRRRSRASLGRKAASELRRLETCTQGCAEAILSYARSDPSQGRDVAFQAARILVHRGEAAESLPLFAFGFGSSRGAVECQEDEVAAAVRAGLALPAKDAHFAEARAIAQTLCHDELRDGGR